jgi:ElaB/YqjD/DUF883 family membrane-anchored ribosome-binding protein
VDSELEMIRSEMDVTRDSLAHKIGELESQVRDTVAGASEAVAATKEGVKEVVDSVSETVTSVKESIKETFDIKKHVEDHPWASLGIAVAVGATGGLLLGPSRSAFIPTPSSGPTPSGYTPASPTASAFDSAPSASAAKAEPGLMGSIFSKIQTMAIASLVDVVQDMVRQSAPEPWRDGLQDIVKDIAAKLTDGKHA